MGAQDTADGPDVEVRHDAGPPPQTPFKIALDLDGVLADSHTVMRYILLEKYNIDVPSWMVYQWDAEKAIFHLTGVKLDAREYLALFEDVWERLLDIKTTEPYVNHIARDLLEAGHDVHIVTYARTREQFLKKIAWVGENMKPGGLQCINAFDVAGWKYEMDYDVFVEDCPHIAVGAVRLGKIGVLYDRPWNRGVDGRSVTFKVDSLQPIGYLLSQVENLKI